MNFIYVVHYFILCEGRLYICSTFGLEALGMTHPNRKIIIIIIIIMVIIRIIIYTY
jgi:hypothetical protein